MKNPEPKCGATIKGSPISCELEPGHEGPWHAYSWIRWNFDDRRPDVEPADVKPPLSPKKFQP